MLKENKCCGMHITKCALILSFIGLIISFLSVISALFFWYYIPSAIVLALVYAFVMVGILMQKPHFLSPALVFLSISVFVNFFMFIALLIIGGIAPTGLVARYADYGTVEQARTAIRVVYFISAAIVFITTAFNIFALYIIHETREYLISTNSDLPTISPTTATETATSIRLPFTFPPTTTPAPMAFPFSIPNKEAPPPPYSEK